MRLWGRRRRTAFRACYGDDRGEAVPARQWAAPYFTFAMMLMEQEHFQKHAIALPRAPEIFRERYDTHPAWLQLGHVWSQHFAQLLRERGEEQADHFLNICAGTGVRKCTSSCCIKNINEFVLDMMMKNNNCIQHHDMFEICDFTASKYAHFASGFTFPNYGVSKSPVN